MKTDVNFYQLDKSKPFGIEGVSNRRLSFFSVFAIILFIVDIIICTFNFNNLFVDIDSTIAPIAFCVGGFIFLGVGIGFFVKNARKRKEFCRILQTYTLTDGKIINFRYVIKGRNIIYNTPLSYAVTIVYSFTDTNLRKRQSGYKHTYYSLPHFYEGQNLMIAFTDSDSMILNKFSLINEDAEKFKEAEDMRSYADFGGVTGELVEINKNMPIKSAEFINGYFISGFILVGLAIIFATLVGIFALGAVIKTNRVVEILVIAVFMLGCPFLLIFVPACYLLKIGIIKRKHYKDIINNEPKFTYAKIYASKKNLQKRWRQTNFLLF